MNKPVAAIALALTVACSGLVGFPSRAEANTRTIVDQVGNTVVLPEHINRVVIASAWPLASMFCLFEGGSVDRLVGLDPAIISAAKSSMLIKVAPDIADVPSGFSKNCHMNLEELVKLRPDVVLYASAIKEDDELCRKAGIPAVGFDLAIEGFNAVRTVNRWFEQLGQVMDKDMSNAEFVRYGQEVEAYVAERLKGLDDASRPRAMFIHGYGPAGLRVPGARTWADYWITAAGGTNVAAALGNGTQTVNMEQVYQWDPEQVFLTNFHPVVPEDLYTNAVQGHDWSPVSATKAKGIHKVPLGMYRWYVTCSDSPLMLLWMAKQLHPVRFADLDVTQRVKDFYRRFYGMELSDADVVSIFTAKREAADGV